MPLHFYYNIWQNYNFLCITSRNKTYSTQKCIKINNNTNLDKRRSNIDSHGYGYQENELIFNLDINR